MSCVAGGRDFLLWKTFPVHKRVLYVSTEDDSGAMSELLKRQNKAWQLSKEEAERVEFLFSCDCIAEKVEACLVAKPVDLVIIDTFGDICACHTGGELSQHGAFAAVAAADDGTQTALRKERFDQYGLSLRRIFQQFPHAGGL